MLIFHEGLPGSGKSYEALISHIIPALKTDRKIYARINGLNYEKLAELTDKDVDEVKNLVTEISEEQVFTIHDHVTNDSLVIIDELQNFFPSGRGKVSPEITQFVTEHRHRGLDIVAMGQSIADVHNLWRRRTQRKIQFLKLDMIGAESRYKWTAFQGTLDAKGDIRFTKINSGVRKYEEKYFGSYASHQADTLNTANLEDKRLNIFSSKLFKVGLPAFVLVFGFALSFISDFFSDEPELPEEKPLPEQQANNQERSVKAPIVKKSNEYGFDFIVQNNDKYDSKITYLESKDGFVWDMIVVWYDKTGKVIDRLTYSDFKSLGYNIKSIGAGVIVSNEEYRALYRFKPELEPTHSVPRDTREQLHTGS